MNELEFLDEFCNKYLKKLPNVTLFQWNPDRFSEIQHALDDIRSALNSNPEIEINVHPDELIGDSLILEIIAPELVVYDTLTFCDALKLASNFEFYIDKKKRLHFNASFEDAFVPILSF